MRSSIILTVLLALFPLDVAFAQLGDGTPAFHIVWEVKNRFRLFRKETDFLRQVAASRGDGVLAAERRLEQASAGLGWAKDVVPNLCLDKFGNLLDSCERDGERENYLAPRDHPVGVGLSGPIPQGATCAWTFDDGDGAARQLNAPCDQEVKLRVRFGRTTVATVDIPLGDGTAQRAVTEIAVRDVLIAGLGDSIAAGEGNPDKAVELEGGFCFRRFGGGGLYYRPSRAGFTGDRSCESGLATGDSGKEWARHGARWMSPACHRSLYSYQVRTSLALAIEQPHLAVTFLPLACTGASIEAGMFGSQRADDCPSVVGIDTCSGTSPAQLTELTQLMASARKQQPQRALDMLLLTIGANDARFASLVANVVVEAATERVVLRQGGGMATVDDAQRALDRDLPGEFAKLREALKPFVGGTLSRVVFVSYANPAMETPDKPCPGGRDGLDIHPAFGANADRLRATALFVNNSFLPAIKVLATCDGKGCRDPLNDRMTFVDGHQQAFLQHGMCVRSAQDPKFDRDCFSASGNSFVTNLAAASEDPMACPLSASDYLPYAPRGRWIRSANDSYFTAMTYPEGMPATLKPADIHDALWGVLSAVYGGAVHPTAEGYAAMADAALPIAREVLGLPEASAVHAEPLPPPVPAPDQSPAPNPPPPAQP